MGQRSARTETAAKSTGALPGDIASVLASTSFAANSHGDKAFISGAFP